MYSTASASRPPSSMEEEREALIVGRKLAKLRSALASKLHGSGGGEEELAAATEYVLRALDQDELMVVKVSDDYVSRVASVISRRAVAMSPGAPAATPPRKEQPKRQASKWAHDSDSSDSECEEPRHGKHHGGTEIVRPAAADEWAEMVYEKTLAMKAREDADKQHARALKSQANADLRRQMEEHEALKKAAQQQKRESLRKIQEEMRRFERDQKAQRERKQAKQAEAAKFFEYSVRQSELHRAENRQAEDTANLREVRTMDARDREHERREREARERQRKIQEALRVNRERDERRRADEKERQRVEDAEALRQYTAMMDKQDRARREALDRIHRAQREQEKFGQTVLADPRKTEAELDARLAREAAERAERKDREERKKERRRRRHARKVMMTLDEQVEQKRREKEERRRREREERERVEAEIARAEARDRAERQRKKEERDAYRHQLEAQKAADRSKRAGQFALTDRERAYHRSRSSAGHRRESLLSVDTSASRSRGGTRSADNSPALPETRGRPGLHRQVSPFGSAAKSMFG